MKKSTKLQFENWLNGKSEHNKEIDECCPDFSCCGGDLASLQERADFKDEEKKMGMLGMFLSRRINKHYEGKKDKKKVYITRT